MPSAHASRSLSGIQVTFITLASICLLVFGTALGFTLGYSILDSRTYYGSLVQIPANLGLLFFTSRAIFSSTGKDLGNPFSIQGLQRDMGGLLAFTLMAFACWVTGTVWFALYSDAWHYSYDNPYIVFFACGFSWVFGAIVTGLCGGVLSQATSTGLRGVMVQPAPAAQHPLQAYNNHTYERHPYA